MKSKRIKERVIELDNISIPRINKTTRDLLQDLIFNESYKSVVLYDDFIKLVDMHKSKRLDNDRFYKLLNGLSKEIENHLNTSKMN